MMALSALTGIGAPSCFDPGVNWFSCLMPTRDWYRRTSVQVCVPSHMSKDVPSDGHVCHYQHPFNAHTRNVVPAPPAKDHRLELAVPRAFSPPPVPWRISPVSHR